MFQKTIQVTAFILAHEISAASDGIQTFFFEERSKKSENFPLELLVSTSSNTHKIVLVDIFVKWSALKEKIRFASFAYSS